MEFHAKHLPCRERSKVYCMHLRTLSFTLPKAFSQRSPGLLPIPPSGGWIHSMHQQLVPCQLPSAGSLVGNNITIRLRQNTGCSCNCVTFTSIPSILPVYSTGRSVCWIHRMACWMCYTGTKCMYSILTPSDAILRHRFGSTLVHVMACCLTAPSHYLKQCWLIIKGVLLRSPDNNCTNSAHHLNL